MQRVSERCGEDQARDRFVPGRPGDQWSFRLGGTVRAQDGHKRRRYRNGPPGRGRFRLDEALAPAEPLERSCNAQSAAIEVDIDSAQAEDLSLAKPSANSGGHNGTDPCR